MKAEAAIDLEKTTSLEERYQLATYKKMPIVAERGEGVWVYASNGDRYLDLYGGHAVAGNGRWPPHVGEAIRRESGKLRLSFVLVSSEGRPRRAHTVLPHHLSPLP